MIKKGGVYQIDFQELNLSYCKNILKKKRNFWNQHDNFQIFILIRK